MNSDIDIQIINNEDSNDEENSKNEKLLKINDDNKEKKEDKKKIEKDDEDGKIIDEDSSSNESNVIKEEQNYQYEIKVGKNQQYKSIQKAIDDAKNNTIIKILPGLYWENLTLKGKNRVDICSLNEDDPAYILSDNSPCIMIHCLEANDTIKLYNLKFIHRGIRDDVLDNELCQTEFFEWHKNHKDNKETYFIYQNSAEVEKLEINHEIDIKIVENINEDNHGNFCAISILKGTVSINNCEISLAFLTSETKNVLPAIFAENSTAIVENTSIKGNQDYLTVGIYSHDAQLKINECRIFENRCGGIISVVNERNSINISKCHILKNEGCGILIMSIAGKSALKEKAVGIKNTLEINIEQNVLELNQGTGLILKKCFNASIIGNKFYSNLLNGADLTDFDGFIMMNNFYKNKGTGLLLETVEESNEAKIFNNFFDENYQNGIEITGKNNYSIISQNSKICNNYLNGIYVHDLANPEIKYNKIYNNSHHGILIESNSCADVNLNEIHHNVRTNIAFGGKMTNKTHITNNEIYSSRNEGVYVVEADGGEIGKNNIYDNNDGIVLIKCTEIYIHRNKIHNNIRTGTLLSDMSSSIFVDNEVTDNDFIGLMIRDEGKGQFRDNFFKQNSIQFYISKNCLNLEKQLKEQNNVDGRYEKADKCLIF